MIREILTLLAILHLKIAENLFDAGSAEQPNSTLEFKQIFKKTAVVYQKHCDKYTALLCSVFAVHTVFSSMLIFMHVEFKTVAISAAVKASNTAYLLKVLCYHGNIFESLCF